MKQGIFSLTALALAVIVAGCSGEGIGRRNNGNPKEGNTLRLADNPAWTLVYSGRSVNTGNLTEVVDNINMQSSDEYPYYIDVVSAEDLRANYSNNEGTYLAVRAAALVQLAKDENIPVTDLLSAGDSSVPFLRLDGGNGKWVAFAYGVNQDGQLTGQYSRCDFTTVEIPLKKTNGWTVTYAGRETITESGAEVVVDRVAVQTTEEVTFHVTLTDETYVTNAFGGDVEAFLNDCLDELAKNVPENENFTKLLYSGKTDILFDRLRHGTILVYSYGVDAYGFLTGTYSVGSIEIPEEAATEDFKKWTGRWQVEGIGYIFNTDSERGERTGTEKVSYTLNISSAENNIAYAINGWETGAQSSSEMNEFTEKFVFEAPYNGETGGFHIPVTYDIDFYTDENTNTRYSTCLAGAFIVGNKVETLFDIANSIDEGKIAEASLNADGTGELKGLKHQYEKDGKTVTADFCSMQFVDVPIDENGNLVMENYLCYNYNTPLFPLTMTKTSDVPLKPAPASARKARRFFPAAYGSLGTTGLSGNVEEAETSGIKVRARRASTHEAGRRVSAGNGVRRAPAGNSVSKVPGTRTPEIRTAVRTKGLPARRQQRD